MGMYLYASSLAMYGSYLNEKNQRIASMQV